MKYDACVDCGKEKTERQQMYARCKSCGGKLSRAGKSHSPATRKKMSEAHKTRAPASTETRVKMSLSQGGDGIILNRRYPGLSRWTSSVKRTFTSCVVCRSTEELEAHHIAPKATYPQWATLIFNGVTLCKPCHRSVHNPTSET